jgi:hypothetical protein
LPENCFDLHLLAPSLTRGRSAIYSAICQWTESRRTHNHTLLSHLRLLGSLSVASYDSPSSEVALIIIIIILLLLLFAFLFTYLLNNTQTNCKLSRSKKQNKHAQPPPHTHAHTHKARTDRIVILGRLNRGGWACLSAHVALHVRNEKYAQF